MKHLLFTFLFLSLFSTALADDKLDSLIKVLDKQIELSPEYEKEKLRRIEALKALARKKEYQNNTLKYDLYKRIYEEYKNFNSDSAFHFSEKMLSTGKSLHIPNLIDKARIDLSFILLSTGMFRVGIDTLNSIGDHNSLSNEDKFNYNYILARTYFDMADNTGKLRYSSIYNKKGIEYLNRAITLAPPHSARYHFLTGLHAIRHENKEKVITIFEKLIKEFSLSDRELAIAASSLAFAYTKSNESVKAAELLAIAAISDIKSSTKETVAMTNLSQQLFKLNRVQEAYKYVKIALHEAYVYKANHRKLEIVEILPIIEGKQMSVVQQQRKTYLYYSILVTILILLVVAFFIIILKQNKSLYIVKTNLAESNENLQASNEKLQEVNSQLKEANKKYEEANLKLEEVNKIKEEYIGTFFNTISENIETIEKFKQAITRKLKFNKVEEIASIIQNIDVEKERERLYKTFDDIFLKIFPGFIEKFNSLFNKEDHVIFKEGQSLTPELRIFALIRLGIQDTETIAKILRYAVRTIYTYKTKTKNKSIIPNEEFEEKLFEIRAF